MLTFNEIIDCNSKVYKDKIAVRDSRRKLTYNDIATNGSSFASYLLSIGLNKKDRIAILAYNCSEFVEVKYASSKINVIITPINFRLNVKEIIDVINDAKPKCLIFDCSFLAEYSKIKKLRLIKNNNYICINNSNADIKCADYHSLLKTEKQSISSLNNINLDWSLMYTSGTTGRPKGVVRDHKGYYLLSCITSIELSLKQSDNALLVMPLCHANSFNFFCAFMFMGASVTIYDKKSFYPDYFFSLIKKHNCSFTSLVPTHFIMILDYLKNNNFKDNLREDFKFMISSAPARSDTKQSILKYFPKASLFELYGSSESGWVTMLKPKEQFQHLGTVGKECVGSNPIKILDNNKQEVKNGQIGELFACTPYNFSHYWNNQEATKSAYFKNYVTVGDLAYRNQDGYIKLVDRKKNMIISGGENIYPAEVENVLGGHISVKDVAVIGYPDKKWGETVCAFIVLEKKQKVLEKELINWSKKRLTNYKCPKKIFFIKDTDMPRNATGKILHKILRDNLKYF